jgi:hypothetical protein
MDKIIVIVVKQKLDKGMEIWEKARNGERSGCERRSLKYLQKQRRKTE